ncbi:MAG TPA: RNA polymerase subunit sigma-24 [Cyanobacteria bacterium UBA8553]|nr:RNA polymerase subunit sigma-24 [Cyanobacteria bacterium UBA8553]
MANRPQINPKAGEALRDLSRKMGFKSNAELAKAAELDKGTLSKIFSGETGKPSVQNAQKLVKAFVEKSCQPPEQVLNQVIEIYSLPRSQYYFYSNQEIDLLRKALTAPNLKESEDTPVTPVELPASSVEKTLAKGTRQPIPVLSNLPRYHKDFIGQQEALTQLLEQLSGDRPNHLISVEGIGGVGKTTLVLEAAYRCQKAMQEQGRSSSLPTFDLIIFASGKSQQLIGTEFLSCRQPKRTLDDIFRVIFRTLNCKDSIPQDHERQFEWIQDSLSEQRTLLIVDNLETIEDQKYVLPFLQELLSTVKIVVTTRWRTGLPGSIHLECLPLDEGLRLIQHQAQEQRLPLISPEQSQIIYQKTGGLPLGIVYAIGQLSVYGISADQLATRLTQANGNLAQHCFEDSVQRIAGQPAHRLLMVLALFVRSASRNAIAYIASPEADSTDALAQLYKLRLVIKCQQRYDMHPLTREYASAELKAHPDFEQQAREYWIDWYLRFSQPYRQQDWKQWQEYQELDQEWENLQAVIDWCIQHNRYDEVKKFWEHLKGYTYVHGYWRDRLTWIEWLLSQAAQQHQDQAAVAQILWDKVWIFSLMGEPEQLTQANTLFSQVSNLQVEDDLISQFDWALDQVIFLIHQRQFPQADHWLNVAKDILAQVYREAPEHQRLLIRIDYYQAEIYFRTDDYEQAKTLYQKALEQAQEAQWQQAQVYIQNWLADVAIEQGNLDEAERLLTISLPSAEQGKDKRSIAFHKRSWAKLEKLRGNSPEFQRWAEEATKGFTQLGMLLEAQEIQSLFQTCPSY